MNVPADSTPPTPPDERGPLVAPVVERVGVGEPEWLGEILRPALRFLKTAWDFMRSPHRFGADWANGAHRVGKGDGSAADAEPTALNPAVFVATAATLVAMCGKLLDETLQLHRASGFVEEIAQAVAPHAYYAALGLVCHVTLRLIGSRRRWTSTVAMAFYAGGTFALLAEVLGVLIICASAPSLHLDPDARARLLSANVNIPDLLPAWERHAVQLLVVLGMLAFLASFSQALSGLHRVHRRTAAGVLIGALLVAAVASNWIPIPTLHFWVHFARAGGKTHWSFGFSDGS